MPNKTRTPRNKQFPGEPVAPVAPIVEDVQIISPFSSQLPLWLKKMTVTFCESGKTFSVGLICGIQVIPAGEEGCADGKGTKAVAKEAIPDVERIERHLTEQGFSFVIEAGIRLEDWPEEKRSSTFENVETFYKLNMPPDHKKYHQSPSPHAFIVPILEGEFGHESETKIRSENVIDWKQIESRPEFEEKVPLRVPDRFWDVVDSLPSILDQLRVIKPVNFSTTCKCYGSDGDELSSLLQNINSPPRTSHSSELQRKIGHAFIKMSVIVHLCQENREASSHELDGRRSLWVSKKKLCELLIWSHLSSHLLLDIGRNGEYERSISNSFHDTLSPEPRTGFRCSIKCIDILSQDLYQILGAAYQLGGLVRTIKLAQRLGLHYLKNFSTEPSPSGPPIGPGQSRNPEKVPKFNHLAYPWKDRRLLKEALGYGSHKTIKRFKWLEWYGDGVLELWACSNKWRFDPNLDITVNSVLERVAKSLKIEEKKSVDKKFKIADVVEALIAAIHLENGCNFNDRFEETMIGMFRELLLS